MLKVVSSGRSRAGLKLHCGLIGGLAPGLLRRVVGSLVWGLGEQARGQEGISHASCLVCGELEVPMVLWEGRSRCPRATS